nr:flippase [uncultured Methanolobus sp.]
MFYLKNSKVTGDIQWSFVSIAISSICHLILRVIIGKELGPSGLGIYTLTFTIYMFGMQFAAFGIGIALTKYVAEFNSNSEIIRDYVSSSLIGSIISGSLMGLLLYVFSPIIAITIFHIPEMILLLKITALCFPFIAVQKIVIGMLNGLRRMKLYAIVTIVQNATVLIMSIVMVILLNTGVKGAVLGFVVPTIVVGLLLLSQARRYITIKNMIRLPYLKEIIFFGFYVVLANSIGLINTQVDSLLLGYFLNEDEVGYYAVSVLFIQGIVIIPQAVQRITNPLIASYYGKKDFLKIRYLILKTLQKSFIVTVSVALTLAIAGKEMISLIFTEEFFPAYYPLLILLFGYTVYSLFVSIGSCLSSIGKVKVTFKISVVSAALNILLNVALIPKYGLNGAASATSISLIFVTIVNLYFINKYTLNDKNW